MDAISQKLFSNGIFPKGTLLFSHDNTLGDILIRIGEGGYWSHVAVSLGDGNRIESWLGQGVRIAPGELFETPDFEARAYPGDADKFIANLRAQLGKPYDLKGLLSVPLLNIFHRNMPGGPPNEFDCSSLVAYCSGLDFGKELRAVTPDDVFHKFSP